MVEWSLARRCKSTWLGSIPVNDMNRFGLGQGQELIVNRKEGISDDRNVRASTSSPCGGVVIGKVLQVNMARINPCQ